jgi:hypothetical protein
MRRIAVTHLPLLVSCAALSALLAPVSGASGVPHSMQNFASFPTSA